MHHFFLNAKLRDIHLTGVRPDYEGSITLDEQYMLKAGILPFEEVHVLNMNTGSRIITYAITGEKGTGQIELNGPAARMAMIGDEIMVLTYVMLDPLEARNHKPRIISIKPRA
jgi:aspartate 1-decarboxylase